jgi:hypothetical protein
MGIQNSGNPLMKYSDAYFDGEIDSNVFSLLSIIFVVYSQNQTEQVLSVMEKLFSKKSLSSQKGTGNQKRIA